MNAARLVALFLALTMPHMAAAQFGDAFPQDAAAAPGAASDDADSAAKRRPGDSAIAAARAKLRSVFSQEFSAANAPDKKRGLATMLHEEAQKTSNPAEMFALLDESAKLSIDAGDTQQGFDSFRTLERTFGVDTFPDRVEALVKVAGRTDPSNAETLCTLALQLASIAEQRDDEERANKCFSVAASLARKTKDQQLVRQVTQKTTDFRDRMKAARETDKLLERYRQSPSDPDVCLKVGSHLCFENDDWESGLPLLSKGSDAALARIVRGEPAASRSPQAAIAVADQWAEWGSQQKAASKAGAARRAAYFYAKALGSLSGLERASVEKRLKALNDTGSSRSARRKDGPAAIPDLVLWLDASERSSVASARGNAAEGQRVVAWRDLSPMGHDVAQPDEAKQPVFRQGAVEFDGTTSLAMPGMLQLRELTVIVVYEQEGGPHQNILLSGLADRQIGWDVQHEGNGAVNLVFFDKAGGLPQALLPPAGGQRIYIGSISDKGNMTVQYLGQAPQQKAAGATLPKQPLPFRIGSHAFEHHYRGFKGSIRGVLLYSRAVEPPELAKLSEWLAKRYP